MSARCSASGPCTGKSGEVAEWKGTTIVPAALPNAVLRLGGMMRRLAAFDCGSASAARGLHRDRTRDHLRSGCSPAELGGPPLTVRQPSTARLYGKA
jgi:hypothetical protein